MIIVVIHWRIKREPEMVEKFLRFWKNTAVVSDRRGLIGEFLTEPHSAAEYRWITWDLTDCQGKHRSFINVGFWNSAEEFHDQIGQYFPTSDGLKDFEAEPRVRTALKPMCWRVGDGALPVHDSDGVS